MRKRRLGCGGHVFLDFRAPNGDPLALRQDQTIVVREFGAQCGDQEDDLYSVDLCTNLGAVLDDEDFSSCDIRLATGRGESNIDVVIR